MFSRRWRFFCCGRVRDGRGGRRLCGGPTERRSRTPSRPTGSRSGELCRRRRPQPRPVAQPVAETAAAVTSPRVDGRPGRRRHRRRRRGRSFRPKADRETAAPNASEARRRPAVARSRGARTRHRVRQDVDRARRAGQPGAADQSRRSGRNRRPPCAAPEPVPRSRAGAASRTPPLPQFEEVDPPGLVGHRPAARDDAVVRARAGRGSRRCARHARRLRRGPRRDSGRLARARIGDGRRARRQGEGARAPRRPLPHAGARRTAREVPLRTEAIYRDGESPAGESAKKIGGAAVGGAILGGDPRRRQGRGDRRRDRRGRRHGRRHGGRSQRGDARRRARSSPSGCRRRRRSRWKARAAR